MLAPLLEVKHGAPEPAAGWEERRAVCLLPLSSSLCGVKRTEAQPLPALTRGCPPSPGQPALPCTPKAAEFVQRSCFQCKPQARTLTCGCPPSRGHERRRWHPAAAAGTPRPPPPPSPASTAGSGAQGAAVSMGQPAVKQAQQAASRCTPRPASPPSGVQHWCSTEGRRPACCAAPSPLALKPELRVQSEGAAGLPPGRSARARALRPRICGAACLPSWSWQGCLPAKPSARATHRKVSAAVHRHLLHLAIQHVWAARLAGRCPPAGGGKPCSGSSGGRQRCPRSGPGAGGPAVRGCRHHACPVCRERHH